MFTHVVLFRMKDRAAESIARSAALLRSMEGRIPSLVGLELGLNQLDKPNAYDISLITRFEDLDGYRAYHEHPYHRDPVLSHMHAEAEAAVVVDYASTAPH